MYQDIYDEFDAAECAQNSQVRMKTSLQARMQHVVSSESNGFKRIEKCKRALEALDTCGWQRSYHQKMFHDTFMRACARVFWKTEKPGQFARDHQKILQCNGWDHLSQEILVSTPRRWGVERWWQAPSGRFHACGGEWPVSLGGEVAERQLHAVAFPRARG